MKIHPVAQMFPMLPKDELQQLADSIRANGLINPCVRQDGVLLDGRNRVAACKLAGVEPRWEEYTGDSPVSYIIAVNMERRHLETGSKAAIGVELKPYYEEECRRRLHLSPGCKGKPGAGLPQVSDRAPRARDLAAKAVGVSGRTIDDAEFVRDHDEELFENIKTGKITVNRAKTAVKAELAKRDLEAAQARVSRQRRKEIDSVCDLRVCSCLELFASAIKPDVVITDPPYPGEFLPVFSELAESCAKAGVPVVAVMSGQSYLPEVMRRLCEHLKYRWMLAYVTPGGQAVQQWAAKVNTFWKPILLFGEADEWFGDVATSKTNDNDKRHHHWGQSESGMADLVGRLSKPGQLVCDPFLGAGTTAVVSLALGRRFVGCDIDAEAVATARTRVMVS